MAPPDRLARVRTFHPRRGRLSGRHLDALDRLWPRYGFTIPTGDTPDGRTPNEGASAGNTPDENAPARDTLDGGAPIDLVALFGRRAPVVLEIGSGMGDATATMASADPDRDYLAVEVHTPGIANLLALTERHGLTNVRIARGDALDLVRYLLPPDTLDAVHAFFPDPWPKPRHHKRRLIQPSHVALLRSRLVSGGTLHCATDWAEYAESMLGTLNADPGLVNRYADYAPRPAYRPVTKFERRGTVAGRPILDLIFHRR
ncbi:tRNA (guanosine(46)-N7)-methyltransferase TrmB [Plantactinospora soyae]|uniref:tRNA (guanosine(46)-N7)-methyltransferase TrmB n=1 Tax=Plantactinospora soyae TaxID=1544732 RepID=UPI00178A42AF|nr:tRNA (guanosine(46)-N7)-methyltransferase TrmB [Plantactinospora soyae]